MYCRYLNKVSQRSPVLNPHIIIDSPPSLSILTINALKAADDLLVPFQPEVLNLQGVLGLLDTVQEIRKIFKKPLPIKGMLIIRYDQRVKLSKEVVEYIKNNLKERLFKTFVRNSVKITKAPSFAKSVLNYAPNSRGAEDFMSLAEEFLKQRK